MILTEEQANSENDLDDILIQQEYGLAMLSMFNPGKPVIIEEQQSEDSIVVQDIGFGFYTPIDETKLDDILLKKEYFIQDFDYGFYSPNNEFWLDTMLLEKKT